ncbi:tetratricopeptide repeat-containing sensor histidine kinase [Chitinophaga agri]|uniref:histidine kinase n=1 Tax=Chitinophaga agri TaxID=2703787 RepID=A0A6B9ZMX9_9BACT|nr:histidine kinase dimerization/phosphoacceptor domain -containing protein [Chitinophaga agri]QHS63356.1 tetratricopeptide repeat protein [Chitinophaga agri]
MVTTKIWFYLVALILLPSGIFAQNTPATLEVRLEKDRDGAALLKQINVNANDTNQVKLTLKAIRMYWYLRSETGKLDTCMVLAKKAYKVSTELKYTEGINEAAFILCKAYMVRNNAGEASKLLTAAYGEQRVKLMLAMAEYYVFEFEPSDPEYRKALPLMKDGIKVCETYRSDRWLDECMVLQGKYLFKSGDYQGGRNSFMNIIRKHHAAGNYGRAAKFWSELGNNTPENDSTFEDIRHSHEMAVHNYYQANDLKNAAYCLRDLAVVNGNHNRTDSSERQLLRVITTLKAIGERVTPTTYNILGDFYRFTGQYDKALYYTLEALNVTADNETQARAHSHLLIGRTYEKLRDYSNSLKHYQLALNIISPRNKRLRSLIANDMAYVTAVAGNPQKALSDLNDFIKVNPHPFLNSKQEFAATFGAIYSLMGDYVRAEKYYLEMLSLNKAVNEENGRLVNESGSTLASGGAYFLIGKFYTARGNFSAANGYLKRSLQNAQFLDADQELETYELLFKTDSALGNYLSAIKHLERHRILYDSINSVQKNRQITELGLKYETEQRLKDIEILRNKETKNLAALQKADFIRNIIIAGALVTLLFAVFAYRAYYNKRRSNRELQAQREEIDSQNQVLQVLLSQKDQFLKEKEWLLKEIHHRVKNNLQIIMSLLNSQSAHLRNTDAIEAITTSGNRVRSIALIHQKLYGGESLSSVNMPEYVADLVRYMMDGFDTRERGITFVQKIDSINIDVAQAVPVGLILNEAITNAVKYAFGKNGGEIIIDFHRTGDGVILSIADNGKGLPVGFDISQSNSLGMEMMQGLAKQLRGKLDISSEGGTIVQVGFRLLPATDGALPVTDN